MPHALELHEKEKKISTGVGSDEGSATISVGTNKGSDKIVGRSGTGIGGYEGMGEVAVSASTTGELEFRGGILSKEEILRVIENHMGNISYCYEQQLQFNPSLRGKVSTRFVIGLSGKVQKVVVSKSTLGNQNVERCMVKFIKGWRFPAPEGGLVEVIFPFVFKNIG